jgi:cytochrome c oxidase subunit II
MGAGSRRARRDLRVGFAAVRRGSIFQIVLIGLVAAAIATAVAIFVPWLPTPASREAGRIDFAYWFATVISLGIFAVVAAVLVYSVLNFRAKPGDWSDGPPVHGNTTIEIIWTIIPAVLVTSIAIVSAIVLAKDSHAGSNPLVVKVYAEQFAWQFQYPNGKYYDNLHLPIDRGVKLEITSRDVLHSFWVPQFSQKQDAVPGQVNTLVITPDRLGTYPVICTELCGLGHSVMRSQATVMSQADYAKWYAASNAPPASSGGGGAGGDTAAISTFTSNGCTACHTFTPIPAARGKVGPDLDKLKEEAAAANESLTDFIRESIVDPDAYIAPGYQKGVMPPSFGQSIPKSQLDALVQYLAANTH